MDYYQYKYFLTVAQTKSFQIAADKLFITRQAVSQSIVQIEKELNYPLFLRTKSGLVLTKEGEQFLPRIKSLIQMQEQMERDMRQCYAGDRQTIRLYYTFTTYNLYEDCLLAFQKEYENELVIQVNGCQEADCHRLLLEAQADIIISTFTPKYIGCESRLLAQYPLSLMMSAANKLAQKEKIELDDLDGETFLAYNSGYYGGANHYIPDCLLFGVKNANYVYSDDLIYLFHRVRDNRGILMGVTENLEGLFNGIVFKLFPEAGTWNHYFTVSNSFKADRAAIKYCTHLFDMLASSGSSRPIKIV